MAKIIDRRGKAIGGNSKRNVKNVVNIAIHYSATAQGNSNSFENFWKYTRKWITGGYHEIVLLNGSVELNYNANVISNGVLNHNSKTYNICYVGDGQPNAAQKATLIERIAYNKQRLGISDSNIKGHRQFTGARTSCPAVDVKTLLGGKPAKSNKPKAPTTVKNTETSIVDYLKSKKQSATFTNRKKLAAKHGVKNYTGTASQNTALLKKLKSTKKPAKKTASKWITKGGQWRGGLLVKGNKGLQVKQLQTLLSKKHFYPNKKLKNNGIDEFFGSDTYDAVRRFQSVYLPYEVDGKAGKNTYRELNS